MDGVFVAIVVFGCSEMMGVGCSVVAGVSCPPLLISLSRLFCIISFVNNEGERFTNDRTGELFTMLALLVVLTTASKITDK